jgi:hypothetical protein
VRERFFAAFGFLGLLTAEILRFAQDDKRFFVSRLLRLFCSGDRLRSFGLLRMPQDDNTLESLGPI